MTKGIIAQDQTGIVRAWTDSILGPVYENIIKVEYIPMWVAMGFSLNSDGQTFPVDTVAHLGKPFSEAQDEYYNTLATGGDDVSVNVTMPPMKVVPL